MFTIDLLKGEGVPAKSRPEGVIAGVVAFGVPTLVAIALLGFYLTNMCMISIHKRNIVKYAAKTAHLSEATKLHEFLEQEKSTINNSLSEVASSTDRHTQWSPVLAALVENMPGSLVLTRLEVKEQKVNKKIPSKTDPKQMVSISIPKRTLQMNVCGSSQSDCDGAVKAFTDKLRSSRVLGSRLEEIRFAQAYDMLEDQPVISYTINCVFKPGL